MKKKYIIAPAVVVVLIFAWVASMAGERVDPTGVLSRLLEIEQVHSESMHSFLQHLKLDYHPHYGTVKKETFPFYKNGWSDKYSTQIFNGKKIQNIESISHTTFSGTLLVAHKTPDGSNIYVWHRYQNEPGVFITAKTGDNQELQTTMVIEKNGNPVYLSSDDLVCHIQGHLVSMRLKKW